MLNAAIYIVFALLLIVSSLLLLVVLMQRPKNEGLGAAFGAQMTDQAFGAQTTDVLKKGTVLFGTLFMLLCFVLGVLMNMQFKRSKSDLATQAQPVTAVTPAPAEQPATTGSNLEAYLQQTQQASAVEPTPAPAVDPAPAVEPAPVAEPAPAVEEPAPVAEPAPAVEEAPAA